jgi:putative ABC transport system ATP-binding protein
MTPLAMPLISVRDLARTYEVGEMQVRALRGVTLEVMPGEFVALTGPSGSGKSTFMHLLGCLDRPTSGAYSLGGQNVGGMEARRLSRVRNREIGLVFQGFNLLPRTSALENVELPLLYGGSMKQKERRERAEAALRAVGLGERLGHHPNQLSGGQQQRVAIARALVTSTSLLLADEPTGNLDTQSSQEIMRILETLNRDEGITIILVTHEVDVAAYAARAIVITDGQVLSDRATKARPPSSPVGV